MTKPGINLANLELVKNMLTEIASSAHAADRAAYWAPVDDVEEATLLHADAIRTEVCRLGWIAERALTLVGGESFCLREGKAENWLMPPSCRAITKF